MNYNFFTINDKIYPEWLKEIPNPPEKIYYLGDINILKNEKMISIVGTRSVSSYGKLCCEKIVKKLVNADVTIVSGFALGVDSIAHETSLNNKGKTIAVIASGIDVVYPSSNLSLWKKMEKYGLILTEYEPKTKPYRQNFPKRNRIIAGLSRGTIVIESKQKGGSLITADLALDFNRDVYAVPGDIFSETSDGCNALIRDSYAKLLLSADEILEEYAWKKSENNLENIKNLSKNKIKILNALIREKSLDSLINETKIDLQTMLGEVMELELMGIIKSIAGGKYKKISS